MKKLFILLLSTISLTAFAQQKVAVYVTGKESGINKVLGDQLVAAFTKSGKYVAIERTASFLAELGKEQNYQRTGAVDDNELSRLGKQFGVQLVCVADVSDVFGEKYVSARLIDVETAEVANTANASSPMSSMNELLNVTNTLTQELTSETRQERAAKVWAEKKEEEDIEKMLIQGFADGYLKAGHLYFTIPSSTVQHAHHGEAKACKIGGFSDWRDPTASELNVVKQACRNYYANKDSYPKVAALNMEQLKNIFDGYTFWVTNGSSIYDYITRTGYSNSYNYGSGNRYYLILVRDAK